MSWGLSWAIMLVSVLVNGFFAGSETAYTTASRVRVRHKATTNQRGGRLAVRLLRSREGVIITALIGNNLAVVIGSAVATAAFIAHFGTRGEAFAAITMAALNIVFGEILPKSFFRAHAEDACLWAAPFISISQRVLGPVRVLSSLLARSILWLLRLNQNPGELTLTRERVLRAWKRSAAHDEIDEDERHFLSRTVASSRMPLLSLCKPLESLSSLRESARVEDALDLVRRQGHSRLPVQDEQGQVLGIVLFRDLLHRPRHDPIIDLLREVLRLDGRLGLDEGIMAFTSSRASLGVVMGEDGRARGIVTLEDLLEPLVGDIVDEHDPVPGHGLQLEDA
jgi:putative hemolysin